MLKLNIEIGDYPVITRVILGGRQEDQSQKRDDHRAKGSDYYSEGTAKPRVAMALLMLTKAGK